MAKGEGQGGDQGYIALHLHLQKSTPGVSLLPQAMWTMPCSSFLTNNQGAAGDVVDTVYHFLHLRVTQDPT